MLLRSSSTPVLGSHLPEIPNGNTDHRQSFPFRRSRSDGNLFSDHPQVHEPQPLKPPSSSRPSLESIPSFSNFYDADEDGNKRDREKEGELPVGIWRELSFADLQVPLFLARGLGIDRVASVVLMSGGDGGGGGGGGGGGERSEVEAWYKRMVEEEPRNALLLRNYAQFLDEIKGDGRKAEEYYSRAILAEGGDGETLSKYAKLLWDRHRDQERASSYFEQAVKAAPQDCNVLAAYAGFLWEADACEDGDGDGRGEDSRTLEHDVMPVFCGDLASASV